MFCVVDSELSYWKWWNELENGLRKSRANIEYAFFYPVFDEKWKVVEMGRSAKL